MDLVIEKDIFDNYKHIPVMPEEIIEGLRPKENDIFVDATVGLAGHSKKIIKYIGDKGRLICIDQDINALNVAKKELEQFKNKCVFVHRNYKEIDEVLSNLKIEKVDGILLDLGVSSYQLEDASRGFSIKNEGPLDMRMDSSKHICAYDLVNSLSENEIVSILNDFGQERWSARIANMIVQERSFGPIKTTKQLKEIVIKAMPRWPKKEKIHPATRTFQAFRIAVNRELESLEIFLKKLPEVLEVGGRVGIISFHSLEDRLVKEYFRKYFKEKKLSLITKKPLQSSTKEVNNNARARSAKLRIAERI